MLALESLLTLNGIMLTEMGGRFMKAVPATEVNRHVPEMLIGTTLELAPSQQIYAKLFRFKYLNAEQTSASIITPLNVAEFEFYSLPKIECTPYHRCTNQFTTYRKYCDGS